MGRPSPVPPWTVPGPHPGVCFLLALFLLGGCAAVKPGVREPAGASLTRESVSRLLHEQYRDWEGASYSAGGMSKSGVDCSGFVYLTYREKLGVSLPRTTTQQSRSGRRVGRKKLAPGDLVFFRTGLFKRHVGIYTGEDRFIHASASRGVTRSRLSDTYWSRAFWKARRVLPY